MKELDGQIAQLMELIHSQEAEIKELKLEISKLKCKSKSKDNLGFRTFEKFNDLNKFGDKDTFTC